jgi:cell pole-organizing protein PopZ
MVAMAQPNQEPSMEDILASIKRIIAEDSEAVGVRPAKLRREAMAAVASSPIVTPVHETEPVEEDSVEEPEAEAVEPIAEAEPDAVAVAETAETPDVLELTSPMPEATATAEAPQPSIKGAFGSAASLEGLLSSTSAEASRSAFAALTQLQVRNDEGKSNTLEGLVSDLLKPMLKEYLDRELPGIVERLVAVEVKRLAGS